MMTTTTFNMACECTASADLMNMFSKIRTKKNASPAVSSRGREKHVLINGKTARVIQTAMCVKHGEYDLIARFQNGSTVSLQPTGGCPKCAQEKKMMELFDRASIPLRFMHKSIKNFRAHQGTPQWFVKQLVIDYCKNIERNLCNGTSLIFCGNTGTGKTHLAVAIGNCALRGGKSVLFTTTYAMIRKVKMSWGRANEAEVVSQYANIDLLILDEVGVQFGTQAESIILFDILNERYNNMKSTIVLTNLPAPSEENKGQQTIRTYLSKRLFDRLAEGDSCVVPFDWASYR